MPEQRGSFFGVAPTGKTIAVQVLSQDITDQRTLQDRLKKKLSEFEKFNQLAIGRELKMIELKDEVNSLLEELGRPPRYVIHKPEYPESIEY